MSFVDNYFMRSICIDCRSRRKYLLYPNDDGFRLPSICCFFDLNVSRHVLSCSQYNIILCQRQTQHYQWIVARSLDVCRSGSWSIRSKQDNSEDRETVNIHICAVTSLSTQYRFINCIWSCWTRWWYCKGRLWICYRRFMLIKSITFIIHKNLSHYKLFKHFII